MIFLIAVLMGGLINRWHGGGFFTSPRWLKQVIWSLPFAAIPFVHNLHFTHFGWVQFFIAILSAISFLSSFGGISTGHGNGQSLGHDAPGKPEKLEYLILRFKPYLSPYCYDFILLQICGVAMVSGGVISFLFLHHFASAGIMVGAGIISPIAYSLGWDIHPNEQGKGWWFFDVATQIGEFGQGAICLSGLAAGIYFM